MTFSRNKIKIQENCCCCCCNFADTKGKIITLWSNEQWTAPMICKHINSYGNIKKRDEERKQATLIESFLYLCCFFLCCMLYLLLSPTTIATTTGGYVHYPSSVCAYMDHSIYTWINQTERIKSFISVHSTYSKATLNIIWQTINVWYPNLAESIAWTWLKQKSTYISENKNEKRRTENHRKHEILS